MHLSRMFPFPTLARLGNFTLDVFLHGLRLRRTHQFLFSNSESQITIDSCQAKLTLQKA